MRAGRSRPLREPRSPGRDFAVFLGCCVGGAVWILLGAQQVWVHARASQGTLQAPLAVRGSSLAPAVPAVAVAFLAGAVAVWAARGAAKRIIGILMSLLGLLLLFGIGNGLNPWDSGRLTGRGGAALGTGTASIDHVSVSAWFWLTLPALGLLARAATMAANRGQTWPGMSSRHSRAAASGLSSAPAGVPDSALDHWRALDRGEDPTLQPPSEGASEPG